jgi:hypothetical protein
MRIIQDRDTWLFYDETWRRLWRIRPTGDRGTPLEITLEKAEFSAEEWARLVAPHYPPGL